MNAVYEKLPALVEEELEAAKVIHKIFHSYHEGYAVMLEEVEEAKDELNSIQADMSLLWDYIKRDDHGYTMTEARHIEAAATRLAAEAIQVAAMARKFQAISLKEWPPCE